MRRGSAYVRMLLLLTIALFDGCGKKAMREPQPEIVKPSRPHSSDVFIDLRDVFFDKNSSELRSDAIATLEEDAQILLEHPNVHVTLEGHVSTGGEVDHDLALGQRRAEAVKDFLVSRGVAAERLETIAYGENLSFALEQDESAWPQNERVHFVIVERQSLH